MKSAISRLFRGPRKGAVGGGRAASTSGLRILSWSVLAALVIGVLQLAQPLEDTLRETRNKLRPQTPSGDIVVIGIDDKSVESLGSWPWPRHRHVEMIDQLAKAGSNRIFFDIFFNARGRPNDNADFAAALARAGNVYLAAMRTIDPLTGGQRAKLPRPEFRKAAKTVSVSVRHSRASAIHVGRYADEIDGAIVPSMPAALANVTGSVDERFNIDYVYDPRRIPYLSAVDLIEGRFDRSMVAGKDIVIGATSAEMGDVYYVPGFGQINGAYVNVISAETLKAGSGAMYGWLLPLVAIFVLSAINIFVRRRWAGRAALTVAGAFLLAGPLVAESHGIFFDIMPAFALFAASAVSRAWFGFRRSYKALGHINSVSGLPNLNALRDDSIAAEVVVGARVRNFAEIISSLEADGERALVDQIVARLALGARGAQIHQGDEGIFVWVGTAEATGPDQLDALHALFRSPALIDGRPIDLSVTFGVDADPGRTLANRVGATLVAADEASVEGLRWKAYDPAKLADAEWKLSLLGRLDAAIDSGEVWVAYQPQLDLKSGRLSGAEALVRWSHPEKGEVSPMEFVLAAEQHNRIDKLTAFVLRDAITAGAAFHARGIMFDVAVNISVRLLEKPGLVPLVWKMLSESGLPPERLTLEVTESAALTTDRTSIRTLEELGSLGINVSIDDYGTGFSTLEYFKKIPATEVKIDRSFVASIDRSASDRLMVQSTIELAHSLGRIVVAEGVETKEILAELTNLGCDKIQGYLIGRPMPLARLNSLMINRNSAQAA